MIIVLEVKKKRTWEGGGGCAEKRSGKNRKMEGMKG